MKKSPELDPLAPRPNLDFGKAVRGKYYDLMQAGTNIVLIAPDLLDTFPDSESVNEALRSLVSALPIFIFANAIATAFKRPGARARSNGAALQSSSAR